MQNDNDIDDDLDAVIAREEAIKEQVQDMRRKSNRTKMIDGIAVALVGLLMFGTFFWTAFLVLYVMAGLGVFVSFTMNPVNQQGSERATEWLMRAR